MYTTLLYLAYLIEFNTLESGNTHARFD